MDNLTNFEPCSIISEITLSYNTPVSSLHPYSTTHCSVMSLMIQLLPVMNGTRLSYSKAIPILPTKHRLKKTTWSPLHQAGCGRPEPVIRSVKLLPASCYASWLLSQECLLEKKNVIFRQLATHEVTLWCTSWPDSSLTWWCTDLMVHWLDGALTWWWFCSCPCS